jgi:hypothetical protein
MDDLQIKIAELETKAACYELLSALAFDARVREENRKRVSALQEQERALLEANSLRLTA